MKSDTSHMGGVRRHVVWKLFGGCGTTTTGKRVEEGNLCVPNDQC